MTSALNRSMIPSPESSISAFRRRVGNRDHGDIGTIRPRKQRHQAGHRLNLPGNQLTEGFFLLSDDGRLPLWRFIRQKPLADRSVGETLKLSCETCVVEDKTTRAEDLIERFQMKRIGVGQRAVNVEQQRLPSSRQHLWVLPLSRRRRALPPLAA